MIKQAARLRDEGRKAGARAQELEQEVSYQEEMHAHARAEALRNGKPEPSIREIQRAKRAHGKAQQKMQDARRAAEMVDADLRDLLAERGPEYGELALQEVRAADREREALIERLHQVEHEASLYRGLYEWVTDPNKDRGFGPVAADDTQWRHEMRQAAAEAGDPDALVTTGFVPEYTPAV